MTGKPSAPIAIEVSSLEAESSTVVMVLAPVQAALTHFATISEAGEASK